MYPDIYRFIAVFAFYEGGISVTYPDLPGCVSHGDDETQAFKNAEEGLKLHLYGMEQDGDEIPGASTLKELQAKEPLQDGEIFVMVEVFMPPYRERENSKFVKKTLSIPAWLNAEAEHKNINFSRTLQKALMEQLNMQE